MSFALKYQGFLDKINNRLPIKWLTKPIDKIHPLASLILFVLIIIGILLLIFKPFGLSQGSTEIISFTVGLADDKGEILRNFEFQIKDYTNNSTQDYRTGNNGQFTLEFEKSRDYALIVSKTGYKYLEQDIDLSKTRQSFTILIFNLPTTQSKAITFVGANGRTITENLNVTVTCQDGSTVNPVTSTVANGTGTFDVPTTCTNLVATAIGNTYVGQNIPINQETGVVTIPVKQITSGTGRATIRVRSGTNFLDGITLRVYTIEDGINPVVSGQSVIGAKSFSNIEVGNYKVVATDDSLRYQTSEQLFTITKDTETQIAIEMSAINVEGNPGDDVTTVSTRDITVIVKDQDSTLEFDSTKLATVLLITDVNGSLQTVDTKSYVSTGVTFRLDAAKQYSLTVRAPGYLPENKTITPNINSYTISLEQETVSNISDINVSVIDEDSYPVIGATLIIYDGNSEYQDTRFEPVVTDETGSARFEGIPNGRYFIKLRKTNVVSSSPKFNHLPPADSNLSMNIIVGKATINLNIKNINEETISFASIKIYNQAGEEIGTDEAAQNGEYQKQIKADKLVYVKVSKTGYYDYYTELLSLVGGETIKRDVKLIRVGNYTLPTADFVGLYDMGNQKSEFLAQNSKYYFKFRMINPVAGNIGIRFMAGEKASAEEDIVYIRPLTESKANTHYYSNTNLTTVTPDVHSKIIDAVFVNAAEGVYELNIPVGTIQATRGQAIPIYYSVYTTTPPAVASLGNQKIYYIDVSEICSETFCISGQYVDTDENIIYDLTDSNPLVVNKIYDLKYVLTNAKSNVYNFNRLAITNVENNSEMQSFAIDILDYTITGGFSDLGSSGAQLRNKIPFATEYINSSQINVYDKIRINTRIKPAVIGNSRFLNKIISNQSVVYNEFINFSAIQQYPFTIDYSPKNIVPGKPFNLTITALDDAAIPVSDAIVNVYQRLANNKKISITSGTFRTNDMGQATLLLPALKNGERIIIDLDKSGYYSAPIEITISQDILSLKQDNSKITDKAPFTININKSNPDGTIKDLTIINNTDYPLQLKPFRDESFSFRYANYLNIGQLQQYLNTQASSITIPANGEENLKIKLATSQDALDLTQTLNITGNIVGYVTVDNSQTEYPFNIPMNVKISVGEGVEEDDCLVVQGVSNPWQEVVSGNGFASTTFYILNNCRVKGNDEQTLALRTIRAKIENTKDQYGYYTLNVDGRTITLSEGSYTTIFNDLSPGEHSATLTYYSQEKKFGDVETKIYINGQTETETGLKYVNTSRAVAFTTKIAIRKIEECIDFYDGSKKINDMFIIPQEINTYQPKDLVVKNNCSDLGKFKLQFCASIDGEPKFWAGCQDLDYDNMEGYENDTLNFNYEDSHTVGIKKPDVPGGYVIPVKISVLNDNGVPIHTIFKNLKVNVQSATLYMEDPFIEVDKNESGINGVYVSQPVKLLNHDINKTPWDYAEQKVGDTGFSAFMNSINNDPAGSEFGLIKFKNVKEVDGEQIKNLWNNYVSSVTFGTGTAAALAAGAAIAAASSSSLALGTALSAAFGPVGIITMAVLVLIGATMPFFSDYKVDLVNGYLDIPIQYSYDGFEKPKMINVTEDNNSDYLNILDVTGERYKIYMSTYINAHGLLASDKTIKTAAAKCQNKQGMSPFFEKIFTYANNKNCGNVSETETESQYNYSTNCDGHWPGRNKIKLRYETITVCKYNENYWPEQSGIKPLQFIIEKDSNAEKNLDLGDRIYKTITFYPTLDDQVAEQDPAFVGSEEIGKFKFAIMAKQYPDRIQADIALEDCTTDSGKSGSTGEYALPKVKYDWTWNANDINSCSDGNKYCDATQLSQVIVNRIIKADELINDNSIVCPRSNAQAIDQGLSGTYSLNATNPEWNAEVPISYTGLSQVRFGTDGNQTKIKVSVQNRTGTILQSGGTLNVRYGDYVPKSYETLDDTGSLVTTPVTLPTPTQTITLTLPAGEDDTKDYVFTYEGTNGQAIIANNINLTVNYLSPSAYTGESGYTIYQTDINASIHQASTGTGCQVPATTAQFNGVDYIDMWFDENIYPSNTNPNGAWNKEDIKTLKNYLEFDAYLITDNYNKQFLNDFDKASGGKASGTTVSSTAFLIGPEKYKTGIYSPLYRDYTTFDLKYSTAQNGVNILVPGKYKVRIDFVYDNSQWKLTEDNGSIDANVIITFTYLRGPENDSVFYRMPVDGFVGMTNNSYSRQNYGLGYLGDEIAIVHKESGNIQDLTTGNSTNSNPKKYLNVQFNNDFFKINSDIETRGNLLTVKEKNDTQIEMIYSPNVATPVLMKVARNKPYSFTAYYQLRNESNNQIMYGGNSLGIWSGVSPDRNDTPRYLDFSGDYVYSRFINFYDRRATPEENMGNSYAIDWDSVARTGNVYLRTIFYAPYNSNNSPITYTLISKSKTGNAVSFLTGNNYSTTKYLGNTNLSAYSVNEIFDKVKTKEVCIVNSENGKTTEFFWNPKYIYQPNPSIQNEFTGEGLDGIAN